MIENTQQNPERSMILSLSITFPLKLNTLSIIFSLCFTLEYGVPPAGFLLLRCSCPCWHPRVTLLSLVHLLALSELLFLYIMQKFGMRKSLLYFSHCERHFFAKFIKYLSSTYMPETPLEPSYKVFIIIL